jgi:diaminopimelate decarboxylase
MSAPASEEALIEAARRFGTPTYVMDIAELERSAAAVERAFGGPWLRHYSLKANDSPALVRRLADRGWGANVVSAGEWALARRAGLGNSAITLEGIGKTDAVLDAVARVAAEGEPLRWVALESADEALALARLCREHGLGRGGLPPVDVLLRLNPQVEPETQAGLAVGRITSKFGMTGEEARALARVLARGPAVRVRGVHVHVGSQLAGVEAWRQGAGAAQELLGDLRAVCGDGPDTVDCGGGFPVGGPELPGPIAFRQALGDLSGKVRWAIEPGRHVVGRAGWILAQVLHVRQRGDRQQVVIDAGMTELIRPALYGAHHAVHSLTATADQHEAVTTDVEGPVCESADSFGRHKLPPLRRGDLLALADTGAYAASLSSRYNGRARPPEVFIEPDGALTLAREREEVS